MNDQAAGVLDFVRKKVASDHTPIRPEIQRVVESLDSGAGWDPYGPPSYRWIHLKNGPLKVNATSLEVAGVTVATGVLLIAGGNLVKTSLRESHVVGLAAIRLEERLRQAEERQTEALFRAAVGRL